MWFVSVDMPLTKTKYRVGIGWLHPIWLILLIMFVIPHDPSSTRMNPQEVGSAAYRLSPRLITRTQQQAFAPGRLIPATMVATTPFLEAEHTSNADVAAVLRLLRLARSRPQLALRIVKAAINPRSSLSDDSDDDATLQVKGSSWATSVELLRAEYGEGRDLTPNETRALYHALLPTSLLEEEEYEGLPLSERAELAIAARRAARLYARERTLLPYAIGSELFDGVRQLLDSGRFRKEGYSDEQIWVKYAGMLPSELPAGSAFPDDVYYTILSKACSSNAVVDRLCGQASQAAVAAAAEAAEVVTTVA